MLTLWVAETAPELPGRLVIVDAMPFMAAIADPAATVEARGAQFAPMVAQVSNSSPAAFAAYQQAMIPQWVTSPEQAKKIAAETSKSDPTTVGRALERTDVHGPARRPGQDRLPDAGARRAGGQDAASRRRRRSSKRFHKQYAALRGVRFEMFDRAKHFIMVDDPAGFQKALDGELAAE